MYISPFHQKCHLRPSGSDPSICALQVLKFDPARPHVCYAARAL